jgi:hypothetical protein
LRFAHFLLVNLWFFKYNLCISCGVCTHIIHLLHLKSEIWNFNFVVEWPPEICNRNLLLKIWPILDWFWVCIRFVLHLTSNIFIIYENYHNLLCSTPFCNYASHFDLYFNLLTAKCQCDIHNLWFTCFYGIQSFFMFMSTSCLCSFLYLPLFCSATIRKYVYIFVALCIKFKFEKDLDSNYI